MSPETSEFLFSMNIDSHELKCFRWHSIASIHLTKTVNQMFIQYFSKETRLWTNFFCSCVILITYPTMVIVKIKEMRRSLFYDIPHYITIG